ncbi:hypothetical protein F5Y16DRAFT_404110 [Xylariaceae sp. FL0255]|nr:hypothetical protein F5Y16DRAFT_404110 [Xylariaceae sp. FL0255]
MFLRHADSNDIPPSQVATSAFGMTVEDIANMRPEFWKFITIVDVAAFTVFTIHWNLCMGTIALYSSGRPDLQRMLAELERVDACGDFMLTEVGHGLGARNIETVAIYQKTDPSTCTHPCLKLRINAADHTSRQYAAHRHSLCPFDATGQRLAYEATKESPNVRPSALRFYETSCMLDDLSWYVEHTGLTLTAIMCQHAKALEEVLPLLDTLLEETEVSGIATSPILDDKDWNKCVEKLHVFGDPERMSDETNVEEEHFERVEKGA